MPDKDTENVSYAKPKDNSEKINTVNELIDMEVNTRKWKIFILCVCFFLVSYLQMSKVLSMPTSML